MPPRFAEEQGQYLVLIYMYTLVNARLPAEADLQRFFGVGPPSVHRLMSTLKLAASFAAFLGRPEASRSRC